MPIIFGNIGIFAIRRGLLILLLLLPLPLPLLLCCNRKSSCLCIITVLDVALEPQVPAQAVCCQALVMSNQCKSSAAA
jgi:hypothetical protein